MQLEQLVDNYVTIDKPDYKQNASESERRRGEGSKGVPAA